MHDLAPFEARECIGQRARLFSSREGDVKQAPLFFEFRSTFHGHLRWKQLFLKADNVDVFEFQAFRSVDRHEVDFVVVVVVVVRVREQSDIDEEVGQGLGLFVERIFHKPLERIQQFLDVLVTSNSFRRFVGIQRVHQT